MKNNLILCCVFSFISIFCPEAETFAQKAVRFGSPGDFIEVPHALTLAPAEFTIELWLKVSETGDPEAAGGEQTILDKRGGENGYNLRLAGTTFPIPFFAFVFPGGVGAYNLINPNVWNHIAATQDQDSLKIYFNGILSEATANAYASATNAPLRIGEFLGYPNAYLGLRGEIDELRIWNIARNQNEVKAMMHEKLTGSETGLAAYWDFDSQNGAIIKDLSPNGNDGSLYGNAALVDSDAPVGFIPPSPPVGLRAYGRVNAIDLVWKPMYGDPGISSYRIYRGDSVYFLADSSNLLASVSSPDSTYADLSVSPGQEYIYQLRAINEQQHASQPGSPALSRSTSEQSEYYTGVYYYPWYDPLDAHKWTRQFSRDFLIPKQPPMLDHYSCRDPLVIRQHLDWMQTYGVDFLVSSWWGQQSWEDVTLRSYILAEIENSPVKFTVYYESPQLDFDPGGFTIEGTKEERLISDFNYIAETYFDHPNILKVEGKPVVFIYLSRLYSGNYEQAFSKIRDDLKSAGYDLFLVGDEVGWGTTSAAHMQFLDAVSPYNMYGMPKYKGYAIDRDFFADITIKAREWEVVAHEEGKFVIPNVHPGFNNLAVGGTGYVAPRQSQAGAESTSMLEEYIKVMIPFVDPWLKMMMITSWNEWHEDTQVEPTIDAPATNQDNSSSGSYYTQGYSYEGYGVKALEVIQRLLPGELPVSVDASSRPVHNRFQLFRSHPNPFAQFTTISYDLAEPSRVTLSIYDLAGQLVETLVNEPKESGLHAVSWQAAGVSPGVYFCILSAGEYSAVLKLAFLDY